MSTSSTSISQWVRIPSTEEVKDSNLFEEFKGLKLGNGAQFDPLSFNTERWHNGDNYIKIKQFTISSYPVTIEEFSLFVEDDGYFKRKFWSDLGWNFKDSEDWHLPLFWLKQKLFLGNNYPVTGISWLEVEAYCNWLNTFSDNIYCRLPTEAEWEWVTRGPQGNKYPWGSEMKYADEIKKYCNRIGKITPVNAFLNGGAYWWKDICPSVPVYDLIGNTWEWSASEQSDDYSTSDQSVLNKNHRDNQFRILKGGDYSCKFDRLRGATRSWAHAFRRFNSVGFRLVDSS